MCDNADKMCFKSLPKILLEFVWKKNAKERIKTIISLNQQNASVSYCFEFPR